MRLDDIDNVELPQWVLGDWFLLGAEDPDPDEDPDDDDLDDPDADPDDDPDADPDKPKAKPKSEDAEALEKSQGALKKERIARRQLAKELKELKAKLPPDTKPPADDDATKKAADEQTAAEKRAAEAKSERLAAKFAKNAVDTAIVKALNDPKLKLKFADPDDVISLVKRDDIDVDQDDDDPSQVEIDGDDVIAALKDLAKRKPHLLAKDEDDEGDDEGQRTPKGGRGKRRTDAQTSEAALKLKYPALTRR